ncbi:hypothetical protein B0H13DRAFT_1895387 [Mycena leptocephala]|nr:hypothetical protein B0H13DRAFT_1898344 [Mycena leptocephala]KAJ7872444.1 hypothetical protein B0H13DRAFT_1895387 [Mycena leptocephala]
MPINADQPDAQMREIDEFVHQFKVVLIETRTPPHIKHKQKAVFPIQFSSYLKLAQDPELPPLPIDSPPARSTMDDCCGVCCICISCVGASASVITLTLSSPQPSATSPSNDVPVPQLPQQSRRRLRLDEAPPQLRIHARRRARPPLMALAFSHPILAATLAFATYTETSKQLDVAVVFASFSLFQLLRQPTMFLPRTLSASPMRRRCGRRGGMGVGGEGEGRKEKEGGEKEKQNEEEHAHEPDEQPPFAMHDFTLSIPRGTLAAVIERVGSGKTSLLQGLVDAGGKRAFGGSIWTTCSSGSRSRRTARGFVFAPRFAAPRGWGLDGGGQKQCAKIARTLYYGADVVIFDDPLSAGALPQRDPGLIMQGTTVLLVTHAQCDYIHARRRRIAVPELIARGASFPGSIASLGGRRRRMGGGEREAQFGKDMTVWVFFALFFFAGYSVQP